MIRSMTGYGRAQGNSGSRDILVEIRSVNNRYYDFTAKLPKLYGYLEEKLKDLIQGSISRGKVEVGVIIYNYANNDEQIEVNMSVANGYINALREANKQLVLTDDITLSQLIKYPDVFNVKKVIEDEEVIWNEVKGIAEKALCNFIDMREVEGERLKNDTLLKLDSIENKVGFIEKRSPEVNENYRKKLENKLKEILEDKNIDEQRILTEVAIFADKTDVDEETVRLRSHLHQFREYLKSEEPVGRRLDFLVQEMNREVNTIGSKSQDIDMTKVVVDMKSDIEKIREQIQNIE